MTPQRNTNGTLIDLLDRVLDKGLVIHADVIVSVAGIPLIGVNLRAALAGMETMLKYGIMQAWDERIRAWETDCRSKRKDAIIQGETIILKMLGACHSREGIYTAWRYGHLYLTEERLLLYHEGFEERLFETPLEEIKALVVRGENRGSGEEKKEALCLLLEGQKVCRLIGVDVHRLKAALEKRMEETGHRLQEDWEAPLYEEGPPLNRILTGQDALQAEPETETCPQCGKRALTEDLLDKGCDACGWISPARKQRVERIEALA